MNYVIDGMESQSYQRYDPSGTRLLFELFDLRGAELPIDNWPPTDDAGGFVLYLTETATVAVKLISNSDDTVLWEGRYTTFIDT